MVEKILNNTTPYGKIRASHEGSLHSSTLMATSLQLFHSGLVCIVVVFVSSCTSFSGDDVTWGNRVAATSSLTLTLLISESLDEIGHTISGNSGSYSSTPTSLLDCDFTGEIIASMEDIGDGVRGLTDADSDDELLSAGEKDVFLCQQRVIDLWGYDTLLANISVLQSGQVEGFDLCICRCSRLFHLVHRGWSFPGRYW